MRIIAGELRGRPLASPPGRDTRPMLDRVRESLFDKLAAHVPGARVLDLFAGTGSLGLEAASRGAASVRCVERDPIAFRVLKQNIESLGLESTVRAFRGDALRPASWVGYGEEGVRFDLVFFDPPYPLLHRSKSRTHLFQTVRELVKHWLAPEGVLVQHTPRRGVEALEFGPDVGTSRRLYGTSALWFLYSPEGFGEADEQDPDDDQEDGEEDS